MDFSPTGILQFTAFVLCFLVVVIAAASGTSGGGLIVPILIIFGRYHPGVAAMFSQCMIFGSQTMNFIIFLFQKYNPPKKIDIPTQESTQEEEIKVLNVQKVKDLDIPENLPKNEQKSKSFLKGSLQNSLKNFKIYVKTFFFKRPIVQYDLFCIFLPATLAGTVIGILFNFILPEWYFFFVFLVHF